MMKTTGPVIQHHVPEDVNLHLAGCQVLLKHQQLKVTTVPQEYCFKMKNGKKVPDCKN
jgi:hypothetical protein